MSASIDDAIKFLSSKGIDCFERMGILVIPVESCEDLDVQAKSVKKNLNAIGYEKSWQIDPYFYDNQSKSFDDIYE